MYFSKATALAVVASLSVALGTPTLGSRQNGVTCQTSGGSPVTGDVTSTINELKGRGGTCAQTNGQASGKNFHVFHHNCTTLATHGEAAISVCGGEDSDSSALSCEQVANYANQIQQNCLNGAADNPKTRTGGTFTVSPSKRVEVINTSSI